MPVHPKSQEALEAAHAALDQKRQALRELDDTADQGPFVKALGAVTKAIKSVPVPIVKAAKAAPKKKSARR